MSLERWTRWSGPACEPYAWLEEWLHAHPGCRAALLASEDNPTLARLVYLGEHGRASPELAHPLHAIGAAPLVDVSECLPQALSQVQAHGPLLSPQNWPHWLGPPAARLRPLPLIQEGRIAWWLLLVGPTTRLEQAELAEFNLRAALALGGARVRQVEGWLQHGRSTVESLAEVQRLLQPDRPSIRGLDYALHWQPAETAAGDYYDLMALTTLLTPDAAAGDPDAWGVMVGDVSGHGAAAAMEVVQFDAILRTYKPEGDLGPAGALSYANRHYLSRRSRQRLMTVLAAGYRPDLQLLRYASAGHLPLLLRRGEQVHLLDQGDMPIGVLRDTEYRNHEVAFRPGDLLVALTDGLTEARDRDGRQFGLSRLVRIVANGPEQPEALLQAILDELFAHQGGAIGQDDQTLVVLKQA